MGILRWAAPPSQHGPLGHGGLLWIWLTSFMGEVPELPMVQAGDCIPALSLPLW